jgi:alkanesulfonate monooxygenase SsuD/methylene tetrahydromethanopterin reductase-like flavin-dependent oxidoreductase (luciferase family)
MKWGVLFASTGFPDPVSAVELGQAAEAAGFESLWAPEHSSTALTGSGNPVLAKSTPHFMWQPVWRRRRE